MLVVPGMDVAVGLIARRPLLLANRVVMAPMTRSRSPNGMPGADVAAYYIGSVLSGGGGVPTQPPPHPPTHTHMPPKPTPTPPAGAPPCTGIGHVLGAIFKIFFLFIAGTLAFALFVLVLVFTLGGIAQPFNDFLLQGFWHVPFIVFTSLYHGAANPYIAIPLFLALMISYALAPLTDAITRFVRWLLWHDGEVRKRGRT